MIDDDDPVDDRDHDDDCRSGPYRDHLGRSRGNPKFGCTGGYCRTGRCESPCDPDPADLDEGPVVGDTTDPDGFGDPFDDSDPLGLDAAAFLRRVEDRHKF